MAGRKARYHAYGWPVELFDVAGRPGSVLAVASPWTPESIGYLLDWHEPGGWECAGAWRRPTAEAVGCESFRPHRPESHADDDVPTGSPAMWALLWIGRELMATVGPRPEERPLQGLRGRGRRR